MNGIFKVNGDDIKIITLNDCSCGQLEDANDIIEDLLDDLFDSTKVTREELNGELIYIDENNELLLMEEWDRYEYNLSGVYYGENIYSLRCIGSEGEE